MQKEFETHLQSRNGSFLIEKWCNTLSDLVICLATAPEKTKDAVGHLPKMMVMRAMHMIINVSPTSTICNVTLVARLQHKVMEVVSSTNAAKRHQYHLPELLADIQTCIQHHGVSRQRLRGHDTRGWACAPRQRDLRASLPATHTRNGDAGPWTLPHSSWNRAP